MMTLPEIGDEPDVEMDLGASPLCGRRLVKVSTPGLKKEVACTWACHPAYHQFRFPCPGVDPVTEAALPGAVE